MKKELNVDEIPLSEWTKGELLSVTSAHDKTHKVACFWKGYDIEAIGSYSCGELISIDDAEVTGYEKGYEEHDSRDDR